MKIFKRAALAALLMGFAVLSCAQSFPDRPVRVIIPYAPGGGTDNLIRILQPTVSASMGQQVVIENRPGGSSIIGTELASKAPPGGYTVLASDSALLVNPGLFRAKMPIDTAKAFVGVSMLAYAPVLLVIHPSVPANTLPELLAKSQGAREGYGLFAAIFAPLVLAMVAVSIKYSPPAVTRAHTATHGAFRAMSKPLKNALFNRLLIVFIFNGIAASIPATLVLFFIQDVVQRPDLSAQFLIAYFAAGALGMPAWVWLSARIGKGRAWVVGMFLSIAAFIWAFLLGPGDATPFMLICVLSGFGLGADLALPPSILADVIDDDDRKHLGRNEGAYFGLWNLVTKMNLALAAGIALPSLALLGYQSGVTTDPRALTYLAAVYALLPCVLKAIAALALMVSPFVESGWNTPEYAKGVAS